ncbi:hypothetical protein FSP39_020736 [Pinctada imbricata]|uniref:TIR domain-containing protein n=1 Tax=Pinctada imbricata TaxID=66713 RepID=A0AA88Y5J3_PINIB|nr:hypothetical protein FSP39_020736 [Pinctada imbricata]
MFTDDNYTIQTRTGTLSIDLNTDEDHLGTSSSAYNSNPDRYSIESETGNTCYNKNSTVQSEGSNRMNRFQTIPLPEGKSYHLFVSHRGDDSAEVWNIIRELEQRFKIRCLYADRDFQPGKDITDNIKEGINKSMKTMLVISPGYLDSGYCWFELKVAFQTSVMQRQNSLIPVILRSFDGELPSALSHLTYIDCMKEPDVPARILDALQDNATVHQIQPQIHGLRSQERSLSLEAVIYFPRQSTPPSLMLIDAEIAMQQNGAVIMEMTAVPYYSSCSGAGWEFKSLNTEQRELFHSLGIKEYLKHFYRKRRPELPVDSYEDFAIDAIETYLEKNQQKLVDWRTLPTSFMNRHNTFRQKACLCQLVLDDIII